MTPELIVDDLQPIDMAVARCARGLTLNLSTTGMDDSFLKELRALLEKHPGRCPVTLRLETPAHGTSLVETDAAVLLDAGLFDELEEHLGGKTWQIERAS